MSERFRVHVCVANISKVQYLNDFKLRVRTYDLGTLTTLLYLSYIHLIPETLHFDQLDNIFICLLNPYTQWHKIYEHLKVIKIVLFLC